MNLRPGFDHERLHVYGIARQLNREIRDVLRHSVRGSAESHENLRRAAKSITRNIAEGSGRWKIPDKVHFYRIARASATECAAGLDELVDFGLLPADHVAIPRHTLARIVAMLTAMIRSVESRAAPDMGGGPPRPKPDQ